MCRELSTGCELCAYVAGSRRRGAPRPCGVVHHGRKSTMVSVGTGSMRAAGRRRAGRRESSPDAAIGRSSGCRVIPQQRDCNGARVPATHSHMQGRTNGRARGLKCDWTCTRRCTCCGRTPTKPSDEETTKVGFRSTKLRYKQSTTQALYTLC